MALPIARADELDLDELLDVLCGVAQVAELLCALRGRRSPSPDSAVRGEVVREITENIRQRWIGQT
jgi:hypothetical protein